MKSQWMRPNYIPNLSQLGHAIQSIRSGIQPATDAHQWRHVKRTTENDGSNDSHGDDDDDDDVGKVFFQVGNFVRGSAAWISVIRNKISEIPNQNLKSSLFQFCDSLKRFIDWYFFFHEASNPRTHQTPSLIHSTARSVAHPKRIHPALNKSIHPTIQLSNSLTIAHRLFRWSLERKRYYRLFRPSIRYIHFSIRPFVFPS